jgi:hypothetical protein
VATTDLSALAGRIVRTPDGKRYRVPATATGAQVSSFLSSLKPPAPEPGPMLPAHERAHAPYTGAPDEPLEEPGTLVRQAGYGLAEHYARQGAGIAEVARPVRQTIAAIRSVSQAARARGFEAPKVAPEAEPKPEVPIGTPPRNLAEQVARGVGGAAGYASEAAALTPFVGPEAALVIPSAVEPGTVEQRAIRAATMAGAGPVLGKAAELTAGAPAAARVVAGVVAPAVVFGSAVPFADVAGQKLIGVKGVDWPTAADAVPSIATLALFGGFMHAISGKAPAEANGIPREKAAAFLAITDHLREPKFQPQVPEAARAHLREVAREASEEVTKSLQGKQVTLNIDGQPVAVRIAAARVFPYPGEPRQVRLVVEDVATGKRIPISFADLREFSRSIQAGKVAPRSPEAVAAPETPVAPPEPVVAPVAAAEPAVAPAPPRAASEPEPATRGGAPAVPEGQGKGAAPTAPEVTAAGARNYQPGERLTVPYSGPGKKATREYGTVVGYRDIDGVPHVVVQVHRGKSVEVRAFAESQVRRRPKVDQRPAGVRNATLREAVAQEAGGDVRRAYEMTTKARDLFVEAEQRAKELQGGDEKAYRQARTRMRKLADALEVSQSVLTELGGPHVETYGPHVPFEEVGVGEGAAAFSQMTPGTRIPRERRPPVPAPTPPRRGVPIPTERPALPVPGQAEELPEADVPNLPGVTTAPAAGRAAQHLRDAFREVVAIANPVSLAPRAGVDVLMARKGDLEHAIFRTEQAQEKTRAFWESRSKGQVLDFWDRYEHGQQPDPRLASIEQMYRERTDNLFKALSRYKNVPYWDNWFPHLWKDPQKAEQFFAPRRPMEGSRRFLKKRFFEDIRAGIQAGLEPRTWNPEEAMQAAEHDVRKFVMVQELKADLKRLGLMKLARPGERPGKGTLPADFAPLEDRWASVYLNPNIEVREYFDRKIMEGLQGVARELGIPHERKMNVPGGALGRSKSAPGRTGNIETRFATPESVLAHEIGHQLDSKYSFARKFVNAKKYRNELRALADLRFEGQQAPESFKRYVRSGPEKMAVMLEALIHAPERFKEVAPKTYEAFRVELALRPETRPLLSIRPSLTYGEGTGEVSAGGIVLGGRYWAQKDLARLLNNHMSRDLIMETKLGRGVMLSRNILNGIELGLSGFHATGMTMLSVMSRMSVGLSELHAGNLVEGVKKMATAPLAPLSYMRDGWRFYKGDPSLAQLERDTFTGGARMRRMEYFKVQAFDNFLKNARALRSEGTPYEKALAAGKAAGLAPLAAIEAPMRFLSSSVIPQMKIGAFRELLSSELNRRAADIASGRITREEIARVMWNNIENRMGLLNYDNLFWNQTFKTAVMVAIRAPGWTLGTLREFGGGAFLDLPRYAARAARGKPPDFTPRMSFALSMVFVTLAVGGMYHRLHTGKNPDKLEDYLHPENGAKDAAGKPIRVDFPTYWKDVVNWFTHPIKTALGKPIGHGGKLAPEVTASLDLLENQTYRGPIRNPKDPAYKQAQQVIEYLYGRAHPFSVQQYQELSKGHATLEEKAESFMGVTRHHEEKPKPKSQAPPRAPRPPHP